LARIARIFLAGILVLLPVLVTEPPLSHWPQAAWLKAIRLHFRWCTVKVDRCDGERRHLN
jgi:hypothetical protein